MGLLSVGTPLPWTDAKQFADHVRTHGINQFLATYKRNRATGRLGILFWGDEVEYMLVRFDPAGNNVTLSLRGYDVLTELMKEEHEAIEYGRKVDLLWRPEYARYMLEGTPGSPYGLKANELSQVQASMRRRREAAAVLLDDNEFLASITCFPRLGDAKLAPFLHPHVDISDPVEREAHTTSSMSLFIPDDAINPHPRFRTLTANIRQRRGEKVAMNMPLFKDKNTPWPFKEEGLEAEYAAGHAKENHIYMDCMCFGMGCSCLQLTLQASHMCEARHLYDQLAVLAPVMLSLTSSSPIFRGYLADVDCRWNVIAGSVDCRTRMERGTVPAEPQDLDIWDETTGTTRRVQRTPRRIPKSRYDSISTYLSQHASFRDEYNDIPLPVDEKIEARLRSEGVDPQLARHIAHLFIRDPLVIYRELLHQDDATVTDHFENLQSTNWQTMRFKPPPTTHPELGWRVEFRAMEVQPSDFENAAFSVFVVLISRVILCLDLDLYIPLSLVDANMQTAHKRDSVLTGKFWFRNNVPCVEAAVEKLEAVQDCQPGCRSSSSVASDDALASPPSTPGTTTSFGHHHESSTDCCACSSFAPRSRSNSPLRKLLNGMGSACTSPTGSSPTMSPSSVPQPVSVDMASSMSALGLDMPPPATNGAANGTHTPLSGPAADAKPAATTKSSEWTQMSINEIMNGSTTHTGLIPLARAFLDTLVMDDKVRTLVNTYMDLIADRAAGRIATSANWMRQFVMHHPEYKHDSRVSPKVAHDLLKEVEKWTKLDAYPKVAPKLF